MNWRALLRTLFGVWPSPPAPLPRPSTCGVAVIVREGLGVVPGAAVTVGDRRGISNRDGYVYFTGVLKGVPVLVSVTKDGYVPYVDHVYTFRAANQDVPVTLHATVSPPVALPALVVNGRVFELANGQPFTAIECSDFQLFQRFLRGEDIMPVVNERRAIGFNMHRVFGMCHGMFRLYPSEHQDYFSQMRAFLQLMTNAGQYVEWTAFADATMVMPRIEDQLAHWSRVGDTVRQCTTMPLIELVNEADQPINRMVTAGFASLRGLLCSHGSNGSQATPVRPWWDYETYHTNDASQWPRKCAHNGMELSGESDHPDPSGVPVLVNENTRPDRDGNVQHFYDAAAGAALLAAGSCFHSQSGKASVLFTDEDRQFAEAWAKGAASVPLHCQRGSYQHRRDLEQPNAGQTGERIYQRGNDDACIVRVRGD